MMTVSSAICFAVAAAMIGGLIGCGIGERVGFRNGVEAVKSFMAFMAENNIACEMDDPDEEKEGTGR